MRRGIILAGGSGTRLHPLTLPVSKQLMPVYDKPMIYYPLSALMLAGIREVLIITTPQDSASFQQLLGDGSAWGLEIQYALQPRPEGLAQAYHIGAEFVGDKPSALILGDNIYYGHGLPELLARADAREAGATVFGYYVANPQSYGGQAVEYAKAVKPSARGELEITDLNRLYLEAGNLNVELMGRGFAWLDTGTHGSLLDAALYVRIVEERQGLKICCPEEIAWRQGFIDDAQLERLAAPLLKSGYGRYLMDQLAQERSAAVPFAVAAE